MWERDIFLQKVSVILMKQFSNNIVHILSPCFVLLLQINSY